jgi:hypothetical protein
VPLLVLLLLDVCEDELEPELNDEREEDDEPLADVTRTASIAFALGRGRPSVRLGPKYAGP